MTLTLTRFKVTHRLYFTRDLDVLNVTHLVVQVLQEQRHLAMFPLQLYNASMEFLTLDHARYLTLTQLLQHAFYTQYTCYTKYRQIQEPRRKSNKISFEI